MEAQGYIRLTSSAKTNHQSVIEFNIVPHEKTPWHYHTLFSETFEILEGTLEVGLNREVHHLVKGSKVTIKPNEKHYFNNVSNKQCLIRVTISPGNRNFENALLISKGLAKDGLVSVAGTPKNLVDLALFVHLNNSKMVGIQKVAAPLFNYLAARAIKKGRLRELEMRYCLQSEV